MTNALYIILCLMTFSTFAQLQPIPSGVYKWSSMPVKTDPDRETRSIMEGTSPHLEYLEIHATTQKPGAKPRPAHANDDIEEVILVTKGKLKMKIGDRTATLGAGSVILLLPKEMHTLENVGDEPLTYFVMRFRSKKPMNLERGRSSGGSLLLNVDSLEFATSAKGGRRNYFDRPTAMCEKFEMHVTRLNNKGPSHQPHAHDDSEIILVLEGHTEMTIDNKEYTGSAGDLYFMGSQLTHGIRNASEKPCTYFAFRWQ